ncbi:phage protein Gp36 family protein [Campylobacter sp. LH-2024]|uniref:phage protein Gp36 family protein n=1 Tax=Campylobacter sp. LH-2024 TaxID=3239825 RepID=UPI003B8D818B
MNYQNTLENQNIKKDKFMIDENDLTQELSIYEIAELSDLNADGVCNQEVINDAIKDAQSFIASFIKIPKNPTLLLKDICVKLTIMELKRRNNFPKDTLNEIIEWAQNLLLKMANKKIPIEINDQENFGPQTKMRSFKHRRKRMDLRRING